MGANQSSTRQQLVKIPNYPCLYRHSVSGTYYGIKKKAGKRKEHSLKTKDRKTAERKLKDWLRDLERLDATAAKTRFKMLLEKFENSRKGKAPKTIATDTAIIKKIKKSWPGGINVYVSEIKSSDLNQWLAAQEARLKNTSYNRYSATLRQIFDIAVADRIISESPHAAVKTKWKKPQKPIRKIPTLTQFKAIVENIRAQKFSADSDDSADFVEFLGTAGLGQAEAGKLLKDDVDWEKNRIAIRRKKTDQVFYVPIYVHLKPLLKRLCNAVPNGTDNLLKIKDAKKALSAACKRLKFHPFTQRNIRQVLISRLWKSRVDYKLISKWQGHQDGGKLILDSYTEVLADDDVNYEKDQLAKIK